MSEYTYCDCGFGWDANQSNGQHSCYAQRMGKEQLNETGKIQRYATPKATSFIEGHESRQEEIDELKKKLQKISMYCGRPLDVHSEQLNKLLRDILEVAK